MCFHVHLLWLRFRFLADLNRQDAVLQVGRNLVSIHTARQRERSREGAERTLAAVARIRFLFPFLRALSADGESIVRHVDVQVGGLDARQIRLEDEGFLRFLDVEIRGKQGAFLVPSSWQHLGKRVPAQDVSPQAKWAGPVAGRRDLRWIVFLVMNFDVGHGWRFLSLGRSAWADQAVRASACTPDSGGRRRCAGARKAPGSRSRKVRWTAGV